MKLTKEQKRKMLIESMKNTAINIFDGKKSLYNLCEIIGIKKRVKYYNMIEKLKPKSRRTVKEPFEVIKKTHAYGLIFKNGFEIKHVDRKVFSLYKDIDVIEIRERTR